MDNLTISAITIVVVLIVIVVMLARYKTSTDRKITFMANHLSMVERNEKARALCKRIHEKHPELCAGIDFTLKENGDEVVIDEWNTNHSRPD